MGSDLPLVLLLGVQYYFEAKGTPWYYFEAKCTTLYYFFGILKLNFIIFCALRAHVGCSVSATLL